MTNLNKLLEGGMHIYFGKPKRTDQHPRVELCAGCDAPVFIAERDFEEMWHEGGFLLCERKPRCFVRFAESWDDDVRAIELAAGATRLPVAGDEQLDTYLVDKLHADTTPAEGEADGH